MLVVLLPHLPEETGAVVHWLVLLHLLRLWIHVCLVAARLSRRKCLLDGAETYHARRCNILGHSLGPDWLQAILVEFVKTGAEGLAVERGAWIPLRHLEEVGKLGEVLPD